MKGVSLLLVCAAVLLQGCEDSRERAANVKALIAAERAFSSMSEERGMRSAFLECLAEDAVVFRPHPVNGRTWCSDGPESKALLTWGPLFADVSRNGDLGYTTGAWRPAEQGKTSEPTVFGQYVSVWRRRPGEKWRVAVDVGVVHPKPAGRSVPLRTAKRAGAGEGVFGEEEPRGEPRDRLVEVARHFFSRVRQPGRGPWIRGVCRRRRSSVADGRFSGDRKKRVKVGKRPLAPSTKWDRDACEDF
jgi:ketosteroid isomerase-like protein